MKKRSEVQAPGAPSGVQTLVLAGARAAGDRLAQQYSVPSKAHIKIAGKSMIARVLEAISDSRYTRSTTVIGMTGYDKLQIEEAWPPVQFLEGEYGPAASVQGALEKTASAVPILVTTCDHALLTPAIVDRFLQDSLASEADLTVALARRQDIEAVYPNVSRTYLNFGDSAYSSCNLFCLKTPAAKSVVQFWKRAEQDRKRPWRIAWRFGVLPALRILLLRPDQASVFKILSKRLGVNIEAVVLPYADAAVDVDTPEDLALVAGLIAERHP